jgi:hypothetical protein
MPKIVSRNDAEAALVGQLQDTLLRNSFGAITTGNQGIAEVGADLESLVVQVDAVLQGMVHTLEQTSLDLHHLKTEATRLSVRVDELESVVENLLGDVSFDEALDHATADLMDCFASSGAADVTADGELAFDERVTFSKSDLKPYLQQAIVRWIERRLEG